MDIDGLLHILRAMHSGAITCLAVDTPVPSLFAHELINAMPYSYLDEADALARRARATSTRRTLPDAVTEGAGRLDQVAIDTVRSQLWPDVRDHHELHDLLLQIVILPTSWLGLLGTGFSPYGGSDRKAGAFAPEGIPPTGKHSTQHWPLFFDRLAGQGRAHLIDLHGTPVWIATERLAEAALLWPESPTLQTFAASQPTPETRTLAGTEERPAQTLSPRDAATTTLAQGWLQLLGPTTSAHLATLAQLHPRSIHQAMLAMEMQGLAMRGVFEYAKPSDDAPHEIEWCERRILQRIHRLTLGTLRKQVEPVTAAIFMRWLLDWHHIAPSTQLTGEEGVLAAIEQLEGFEAPAIEWERTLLPARVANYDPQWLDNLCLAGIIGWGRISPHPAWSTGEGSAPRRVIPTTAAPITFYLRESSEWLHAALAAKCVDDSVLTQSLSPSAQTVRALLSARGAAFTADLQRLSNLDKLQTSTALWELATAGLASADGFDQLRAMMDPRRKSASVAQTSAVSLRKRAAARTTAGRWSLLCEPAQTLVSRPERSEAESPASKAAAEATQQAIAAARRTDAALDAHARILLCRYGVLFRELLVRESNAPKWRDLLPILRRLEARGEIRGGRFVSGAFGEQFCLPEAVESLRSARRQSAARATESPITVAATDPLNLVGILVPGDRISAIPGNTVCFVNGSVLEATPSQTPPTPSRPRRTRSIADLLRSEALAPRTPQPAAIPGLFS
jgi:ATP-dependent Lhr-like helicase